MIVAKVYIYPYPSHYQTQAGETVCYQEQRGKWKLFVKEGSEYHFVRSYTRHDSVRRRISGLAGL